MRLDSDAQVYEGRVRCPLRLGHDDIVEQKDHPMNVLAPGDGSKSDLSLDSQALRA